MTIEVSEKDMALFCMGLRYAHEALVHQSLAWDRYKKEHNLKGISTDYEMSIALESDNAREASKYVSDLLQDVRYRNTVRAYFR